MTRQNKFKVGDVVFLKSGSPTMTVTDFPGEVKQTYTCYWHDYNTTRGFHYVDFPEDALELHVEKPKIKE